MFNHVKKSKTIKQIMNHCYFVLLSWAHNIHKLPTFDIRRIYGLERWYSDFGPWYRSM